MLGNGGLAVKIAVDNYVPRLEESPNPMLGLVAWPIQTPI